jgi:SAM-dependent methyltransferase
MVAMSTYVAPEYWEETLAEAYDESGVGYPNLARSFNRARYVAELRGVTEALEAVGVTRADRVLDVGSGTGIWIDFWQRRGAREVSGLDLTEKAVERLRARYPDASFAQADVAEPATTLPSDCDAVSVMSVLTHVTDDARFEQALRNIAAAVRPGGVLVMVEPAVVHRWWGPPFGPEAHSKSRPLDAYRQVLAQCGMDLVHIRPLTCLLANPVDTSRRSSFRLLNAYWTAIALVVGRRERVGRAAGALLGALDRVAVRAVSNGPSAKIVVARRPPT